MQPDLQTPNTMMPFGNPYFCTTLLYSFYSNINVVRTSPLTMLNAKEAICTYAFSWQFKLQILSNVAITCRYFIYRVGTKTHSTKDEMMIPITYKFLKRLTTEKLPRSSLKHYF